MTENEPKPPKLLEEELESLREKIAHIQSFVQQHEKESLLKPEGDAPAGGGKPETGLSFLEEGPLGMALVDPTHRIVRANRTLLDQLGYAGWQAPPLEMPAVVGNDATCLQILNQVLDGSLPSGKTDVEVLRKNGERFWAQCTVAPAPHGEACLVLIEDITDRKQAEAVFLAEKQLLQRLVQSSVDGIVAFDRDLFFTVWNPAMEKLLGIGAQKTLGRHAFDCCPFLEELGEGANFLAAIQGGKAVSKDKRYTIPGTARQGYFEAYYGPIYGADAGQILGGLAIFRDTTERVQLEESKRASEQRYRELVENAYDMVYTHDMAGRITSINKAGERILGYTRSEAYQMHFQQFVAPEFQAAARRMLDRQINDHVPEAQEIQVVAKDGKRATLEVSTRLIFREGKAVGIQGIARDTTERKKWEDALKEANRRLEEWVEELERRTHEMSLLSEMGDILRACMNTREVYDVIVRVAQEIFPVRGGALYVIGPARNIVESVAEWGDTAGLEMTFAPNECWALRRGRLHWVEDCRTGLLCKHLHAPVPSGYLCVPMMAQSEAIGILHLAQAEGAPLPEAKQKLAVAMAEHIAMALSHLRLHEKLRSQSIRDPLTGLFNRSFMEESLELELRRSARSQKPLSVLMLRIDAWGAYVEQCGRDAGNQLLCDIGQLVQSNVRKGDVACRYGQQAFVLVLPSVGLEVARKRAESLRELVAASRGNRPEDSGGTVTASIGLAVFPEHGQTVESLRRSAEAALNRAGSGGNKVVVAH